MQTIITIKPETLAESKILISDFKKLKELSKLTNFKNLLVF